MPVVAAKGVIVRINGVDVSRHVSEFNVEARVGYVVTSHLTLLTAPRVGFDEAGHMTVDFDAGPAVGPVRGPDGTSLRGIILREGEEP